MTLLGDIQAAALDSSIDLADALRKCKVLAARLKHKEFADWVTAELNGYTDPNSLPDYRRTKSLSLGTFIGPMGVQMKNAPIPPSTIPTELRKVVTDLDFGQPVSTLAEMFTGSTTGTRHIPWPADVLAYVQAHATIIEDMVLADAHLVVTAPTVKGVLDAVRTRILDFALAIEAENPEAGEASPAAPPPIPQDRLGDIFHVVVHQGSQVIIGNRGNASIATGAITFSSAIPSDKHPELASHLADLRSKLDAVPDEAGKADAKDALVKLESQLAKPKPDPARTQSYLQLYATIITAAAPTVAAMTKLLQAIGWLPP